MANNEIFNETIGSLLDGMNGFLSTKTVVGEPIEIGETIIIPLVNVSFGMGAGTMRGKENINTGGGMGGKMSPSAVIVIKNGSSRVINISTNTGLEKLIDMVPDFVASIQGKINSKGQNKDARDQAAEEIKDMIDESVFDDGTSKEIEE